MRRKTSALPMIAVMCLNGQEALVRPRDVAVVYNAEVASLSPHYTLWLRTGQVIEVLTLEPWTQFKRRFGTLQAVNIPTPPRVPRHLMRLEIEQALAGATGS